MSDVSSEVVGDADARASGSGASVPFDKDLSGSIGNVAHSLNAVHEHIDQYLLQLHSVTEHSQ